MKIFKTFLLAIMAHFSFAQISFFKELNTQEEGSSPANFTEVNGITFFSVNTIDGYNLWKTDGTEAGTVVVSTQAIDIHETFYGVPNFYVFNNELYYYVQKPKIGDSYQLPELWRTDGTNNTLVANEIPVIPIYYLNNAIYYQSYQSLYKIEGGISVKVKDFGTSNFYTKEPPIILDNQLIFYTTHSVVNEIPTLQVWRSDGTTSGTTIIKDIDKLFNFDPSGYEDKKLSLKIGNQVYFIIKRDIGSNNVSVELWKTDGVSTMFIKEIANYDYFFDDSVYRIASKLANFNGKLLFNFYNEIWISDGTLTGTNKVKTISSLNYDVASGKWGILNDKFYFAGFSGTNTDGSNDFELWQSDGTTTGTLLLKNISPANSSNPNYFKTINNKLYFKAQNEEIWQSDGTMNGTVFIQNIPKPANSPSYYQTKPELIYTSNNYLLYSYYSEQNGFELWKTNGVSQNLLKNISTAHKTSLGGDKKVKLGNTWYFNGMDYRGAELWKSDGTPEGTVLVKDLNTGSNSSIIQQIVAVGNLVYFTVIFTGENTIRFYKSDGTEVGTVAMNVDIYAQTNYLTPSNNYLFFMARYFAESTPWIHNEQTTETRPISTGYLYDRLPDFLVALQDRLTFSSYNGTYSGLWISDGSRENTKRVCENETVNVPLNPICNIEFKNKLYFFSFYYDSNSIRRYALFESDGTKIGTKIVKEFDQNLVSSYALFLEKSNDRIYFRATFNLGVGFDLWASDGTAEGTVFLKTVNIPYTVNVDMKFAAVGSQFYIFINQQYSTLDNVVWTSDGTVDGTKQILLKQNSPAVSSIIPFKCKLYFNLFDTKNGKELWESDGTVEGTHLTGEVITGTGNSHVENLISFENKLVFWANSATSGTIMWQYLPPVSMAIKNQTTQSGTWDSSNTWSCGKVPSQDDIIIIKAGHTIIIPDNFQTTIKGISTENGAVLKIPQSAVFTVNPK